MTARSYVSAVEVTAAARAFLDPVLAGGLDATWSHRAWAWAHGTTST